MEIPFWLQNSTLYKSEEYKEYDGEDLLICNLSISSLSDFKNVFNAMKFWEVESPLPYEIWEFVLNPENKRPVNDFLVKGRRNEKGQLNNLFISGMVLRFISSGFAG